MYGNTLIGGIYEAKIKRFHGAKFTGSMVMSGMAPIHVDGRTRGAVKLALHVFIYGEKLGHRKYNEGLND